MYVNNPQLNLYHQNLVEQKRLLTEETLKSIHNNLDRIEKEMLEDYNKRIERMKEVSVTPRNGTELRKKRHTKTHRHICMKRLIWNIVPMH